MLFRITPAHAGKTVGRFISAGCTADHPRACGENLLPAKTEKRENGSPPRMRGKLRRSGAKAPQIRITPAHAGKTKSHNQLSFLRTDHPRACGENEKMSPEDRRPNGSPPRMRGKPPSGMFIKPSSRITPAHAGKTRRADSGGKLCADHPRACGENKG